MPVMQTRFLPHFCVQTPYFACIDETEADKTKLKEALLKLKDVIVELDQSRADELKITKKTSKTVEMWK